MRTKSGTEYELKLYQDEKTICVLAYVNHSKFPNTILQGLKLGVCPQRKIPALNGYPATWAGGNPKTPHNTWLEYLPEDKPTIEKILAEAETLRAAKAAKELEEKELEEAKRTELAGGYFTALKYDGMGWGDFGSPYFSLVTARNPVLDEKDLVWKAEIKLPDAAVKAAFPDYWATESLKNSTVFFQRGDVTIVELSLENYAKIQEGIKQHEIREAEKKEAAAKKKAEAEAETTRKCQEAKDTGKPVLLTSYTDDCNDPDEDCSLDIVNVFAMPDGTTKTKRQHTW